jgi:hypothetical protein
MVTLIKSVNLIVRPLIKDNNKFIILYCNTNTSEICALMGYHIENIGNSLLTFRDGPATSVRNYCYTLRDIPEERKSHLLRSGSLKSRAGTFVADHKLEILKIPHLEMRGLDLQFPCVTAKILHSMVLKSE